MQSGLDAFENSRIIMTFLTTFGVREILCDFRLFLEGKTVKEIPESSRLELLQKLSKVVSNSPKVLRAWVLRNIYDNSNLDPLTKLTSSSRSTEFKDIFWWKISQMITNTIPINTRIVITNAMKWGILLWIRWKVNGNWDKNLIKISQWRESLSGTNDSIRRKKELQKSQTVRITVWELSRKVDHLNKVTGDRKIMTEFTRSISSTRIGWPVLMMDIKVSKDKHISRWVDRENIIYRVVQKSILFCFSSQSCVLQYFSIFFRWCRQQDWGILLTPIWIQLNAILRSSG